MVASGFLVTRNDVVYLGGWWWGTFIHVHFAWNGQTYNIEPKRHSLTLKTLNHRTLSVVLGCVYLLKVIWKLEWIKFIANTCGRVPSKLRKVIEHWKLKSDMAEHIPPYKVIYVGSANMSIQEWCVLSNASLQNKLPSCIFIDAHSVDAMFTAAWNATYNST